MGRFRVLVIPVAFVTLTGPATASRTRPSTKTAKGHGPAVNVAHYGVSCTGLTGSLHFSPPLVAKASAKIKKEKVAFSASLSDCAAVPTAGGTPVAISSGKLAGKLTVKAGPSGIGCEAVLAGLGTGEDGAGVAGKLSATWVSSSALSPTKTTISVKSAQAPLSGNANVAQTYLIPGPDPSTIAGAFAGASNQSSLLALVSGLTPEQEGLACSPSISGGNGLTILDLAGGLFDNGSPPSSIAVSPANASFSFSHCYSALGTFPGGTADLSALASWSTGDSDIASVVTSGIGDGGCVLIGTGENGTTSVSAAFDGTVGSTDITVVSPVTITTSSLPDGSVGVPYDQTLTASGGTTPYSWAVEFSSLPDGLMLDSSTGEITGTPLADAAGDDSFTVQVTDSSSPTPLTDTESFSITVN
jgi:hypothetical protein